MNKNFLSMAILCIVTMTAVLSCKKDSDSPQPTELEITVSDELGNKVSGATVGIFSNLADWEKATNPVQSTQTTDINGIVKFSHLTNARLYWAIIKDCKNNANGSNTTTEALSPGKTTKVGAVITSTGTLKFVNTSANTYSVYINNVLAIGAMAGNSNQSIGYKPVGNYTIRVEQVGGSNIKTYSGNVVCGGTLTTTFP